MTTLRIRGEWILSLLDHGPTPAPLHEPLVGHAKLLVASANRNSLAGELHFGKEIAEVAGRIRHGNPGTVLINEVRSGKIVDAGVNALLYVPPFWPHIDYNYDILIGILSIANESVITNDALRERPLSISGVQVWPDVMHSK